MAILKSCGNGKKQGKNRRANVPKEDQLGQRKSLFSPSSDSEMLVCLKELALDPTDAELTSDSVQKLSNQMLRLRKFLLLSNAECPRRKRKLEMFLKDGNVSTASGLAPEKSSRPNVKKLGSKSCSVSCLPDSSVTNECSSQQTVRKWCSSGSVLTFEDGSCGKHVYTKFRHLGDARYRGPSNKDTVLFTDTDESVNGSNPLSPENLIVQDTPLVDSDDSVRTSDTLSSQRKLREAVGFLVTEGEHTPRPVIPVGPSFQAELPEWVGPIKKGNLYGGYGDSENLKWLGTKIWPIEGRRTIKKAIGKERPESCSCVSSGSADCIKHHILEARRLLKSDLGSAFFSWKFDEMGEAVSKSWTLKEEQKFESLVKNNPLSSDTDFWELASELFPSKLKKSMLSYYYNVFLLRRMSLLTRCSPDEEEVESDEDQIDDDEEVEDDEDAELSIYR